MKARRLPLQPNLSVEAFLLADASMMASRLEILIQCRFSVLMNCMA